MPPPQIRFKISQTIRENFCKNYFFVFSTNDGCGQKLAHTKNFGSILNMWKNLVFEKN